MHLCGHHAFGCSKRGLVQPQQVALGYGTRIEPCGPLLVRLVGQDRQNSRGDAALGQSRRQLRGTHQIADTIGYQLGRVARLALAKPRELSEVAVQAARRLSALKRITCGSKMPMANAVRQAVMGRQRIGAGMAGAEHRILDGGAGEDRRRAAWRRGLPGRRAAAAPFPGSAPAASRPRGRTSATSGLRLVVTYDSRACDRASMPVRAVTLAGCETVTSGSRMATRKAALRSPQAIFRCVLSSAIRAYDCASLPVPAVVGTPIDGSIGFVRLAEALVVGHLAAVGEQEVDPLGAVHRAAAADADDQVDVCAAGEMPAPASTWSIGRVLLRRRRTGRPPARPRAATAWPAGDGRPPSSRDR